MKNDVPRASEPTVREPRRLRSITFKYDAEMLARIDRYARACAMSRSTYIRHVLERKPLLEKGIE